MTIEQIANYKFEYGKVDEKAEKRYEQYCEETGDDEIKENKAKADEAVRSANKFYIG